MVAFIISLPAAQITKYRSALGACHVRASFCACNKHSAARALVGSMNWVRAVQFGVPSRKRLDIMVLIGAHVERFSTLPAACPAANRRLVLCPHNTAVLAHRLPAKWTRLTYDARRVVRRKRKHGKCQCENAIQQRVGIAGSVAHNTCLYGTEGTSASNFLYRTAVVSIAAQYKNKTYCQQTGPNLLRNKITQKCHGAYDCKHKRYAFSIVRSELSREYAADNNNQAAHKKPRPNHCRDRSQAIQTQHVSQFARRQEHQKK